MKKVLFVLFILISSLFCLNVYAVQHKQQMVDVKKSMDAQQTPPDDKQMMDDMTDKMMGSKLRSIGRRMMRMGVKMRMMGMMMEKSEDTKLKMKGKMMVDLGIKNYSLGRDLSSAKQKRRYQRYRNYY